MLSINQLYFLHMMKIVMYKDQNYTYLWGEAHLNFNIFT